MSVVGLDIGGANLKAAMADGRARTRPFALWKRPGELANELRALLADWLPCDRLAVTMTGELCDCFANRNEGVRHILAAVNGLAPQVSVWNTRGQFASIADSQSDPLPVASANWLALATYAGRLFPDGSALLIDMGSTTTDIIPLVDGRPTPMGRTDSERLASRELVYTGVRRTPICALLEPGEGMAELFATTLDAYLILGQIDEDDLNCQTADGRPATRAFARARLARMLGSDAASMDECSIHRFAEGLHRRQGEIVANAMQAVVERFGSPIQTAILSGTGTVLAREVVQQSFDAPTIIDLTERLGAEVSEAACAYAVAMLFKEPPRN